MQNQTGLRAGLFIWRDEMFHIITKDDCRYCKLAKSALRARGLDYTEEVLTPESWAVHKAGGMKTVPQVYVEKGSAMHHIGGFEDLVSYLNATFPSDPNA